MSRIIKMMLYIFCICYMSTSLIPFCFNPWVNQDMLSNMSTNLYVIMQFIATIFLFYSDYDIDLENAVMSISIILCVGLIVFIFIGIMASSCIITFGFICMYLKLIYNYIKYSKMESSHK